MRELQDVLLIKMNHLMEQNEAPKDNEILELAKQLGQLGISFQSEQHRNSKHSKYIHDNHDGKSPGEEWLLKQPNFKYCDQIAKNILLHWVRGIFEAGVAFEYELQNVKLNKKPEEPEQITLPFDKFAWVCGYGNGNDICNHNKNTSTLSKQCTFVCCPFNQKPEVVKTGIELGDPSKEKDKNKHVIFHFEKGKELPNTVGIDKTLDDMEKELNIIQEETKPIVDQDVKDQDVKDHIQISVSYVFNLMWKHISMVEAQSKEKHDTMIKIRTDFIKYIERNHKIKTTKLKDHICLGTNEHYLEHVFSSVVGSVVSKRFVKLFLDDVLKPIQKR